MLIPYAILERIRRSEVTVAFRRWKEARVTPGSRFLTRVGVIEVTSVREVRANARTPRDAKAAGADSLDALRREQARRSEPRPFRIGLRYAGPDPRTALRQKPLSADDLRELQARLARLDRASREGPWTLATLRAIAEYPGTAAGVLAERLGRDKERLKLDVRKLKNLGLTESLQPGYRLSPRGRALLEESQERSNSTGW